MDPGYHLRRPVTGPSSGTSMEFEYDYNRIFLPHFPVKGSCLPETASTGAGEHKDCLTKISDGFKGRGLVIFISDMLEGEDDVLQFLKAMRFSNNDCILLQLLDNDEIDFPYSKNVRFVGMEQGDELVTAPELIRENYQKNLGMKK